MDQTTPQHDPQPKHLGGADLLLTIDWPAVRRPVGIPVCSLLSISDDLALARQFTHGLHLQFAGFSRVPEAIVEVRTHLQHLNAMWPWWMHFLAPDVDQWRTLLLALTPLQPDASGGWATDRAALASTQEAMTFAARVLHSDLDLSPLDREQILERSRMAMKQAVDG